MTKIVSNFSIGNRALEFIDHRIQDDAYRGPVSSEHNRYTVDDVCIILRLLDRYAPDLSLMRIRDTDNSKRPENSPEETIYSKFCVDAKLQSGKGTQDAMRKNLFVDFHRMGFIKRYDIHQHPTDPWKKQHVKYVSLSVQGKKLIEENDRQNRLFIFTKGLDLLLGGYINTLLEILRNEEYKIGKLSIYEFMFFVTAVGADTSFSISIEECVELILSFRCISVGQRKSVIRTLQEQMRPENYVGDKTQERDFHNWKNKAAQIFSLLKQTVHFEQRDEHLYLLEIKDSTGKTSVTRLKRSTAEKIKYFKQHNVCKRKGFELHHIVPLSWAESLLQFKLIDEWRNMLYINAYKHAIISQNQNWNVHLDHQENDLLLTDYAGNAVELAWMTEVLYSQSHLSTMIEYNKELLHEN